MEQENSVQPQNPNPSEGSIQQGPVATQPVVPVQPEVATQAKKGTPVWVWLLGGCLVICLLAFIGAVALGWWGIRKAKHELKKYEPGMEQMQQNLDKFNKEADEWQKKSEEMRNSMPNPEDYPNGSDYESQ